MRVGANNIEHLFMLYRTLLSYILYILYCPILSYILLPPFIYSYTLSLLYILLYTALSYTQPRIFYTTLIYSIIYSYILSYILSFIPLYTLLFSNDIINLAPPFYTSPLLYTILLYTYPPFFTTLLYTLYCPSSYILLYPLSYMERV